MQEFDDFWDSGDEQGEDDKGEKEDTEKTLDLGLPSRNDEVLENVGVDVNEGSQSLLLLERGDSEELGEVPVGGLEDGLMNEGDVMGGEVLVEGVKDLPVSLSEEVAGVEGKGEGGEGNQAGQFEVVFCLEEMDDEGA